MDFRITKVQNGFTLFLKPDLVYVFNSLAAIKLWIMEHLDNEYGGGDENIS